MQNHCEKTLGYKGDVEKHRYMQSEVLLERASKVIPLGTQTFSKSKTQYPHGVSPFYISHAQGANVWDVDGNQYIDFINGLAAITLGYNDPDVTQAVKEQLEKGTIFSLPGELEITLAEKLIELIPCAEMVRFGKNGSDVTTAAIRLARAYTGRDHVAVGGYHGWHDWYIGTTTRNLGIPKATQELSHKFSYNNLDSLISIFEQFPGQVAAVILEPMTFDFPKDDFLKKVKEVAHAYGAVLIFDEVVTGFRLSLGGAQELFGVTPDLATFGKGMSNGYPLSALVGKKEIMQLCEEIFFSFTFGGELLSLAASLATIHKLQRVSALEKNYTLGNNLMLGANQIILDLGLEHVFKLQGHPSWSLLSIADTNGYSSFEIKTLLLQELFTRGILALGTHNMSYAHEDAHITYLLESYREIFEVIRNGITNKTLHSLLRAKPLQPLFKVR